MEQGLVHIYCGDGKGKTTCAVGLMIRCAGQGGRVLCFQFLKGDNSGERRILEKLEKVTLMSCYGKVKFTSKMNEEEKLEAKTFYQNRFQQIITMVQQKEYDLLVLEEKEVVRFLQNKPGTLEVVMTGRNPGEELLKLADYVTEMKMCKHPYEKGISARRMIEW